MSGVWVGVTGVWDVGVWDVGVWKGDWLFFPLTVWGCCILYARLQMSEDDDELQTTGVLACMHVCMSACVWHPRRPRAGGSGWISVIRDPRLTSARGAAPRQPLTIQAANPPHPMEPPTPPSPVRAATQPYGRIREGHLRAGCRCEIPPVGTGRRSASRGSARLAELAAWGSLGEWPGM